MRLKMILILSTLIAISGCQTTHEVLPVLVPEKTYTGTVHINSILLCPEPVRKEVYRHLRQREQYIETIIDVINAHNKEVVQ